MTRQWLRQQLYQPRTGVARWPSVTIRRYATDEKEKEERESFKGQLYQSTSERVQRERADEARFARQRDAQRASSSSGAFLLTSCKLMSTPLVDEVPV